MRRLPIPHVLRPPPPLRTSPHGAATSTSATTGVRYLLTTRNLPTPRRPAPPSLQPPNRPYTTPSPTAAPPDPSPDTDPFDPSLYPRLPYRFATGIALFAKRPPRPFPPPFLSPPSASFSDALSTFDRSRLPHVDGRVIQGHTNGDDAVYASAWFICANDGVGAWSARPRGHAGLWARLILHYWATEVYRDAVRRGGDGGWRPEPVEYLERAYERTKEATGRGGADWQGTTTAAGAQLHVGEGGEPVVYVTNVGDSGVMVVRPGTGEMVYKSQEQWHWFDCPRQLGTNSPDTPRGCAVVDEVVIREGDVVLAMSDGVIDNLWTHEIVECVCGSVKRWKGGKGEVKRRPGEGEDDAGMRFVAEELKEAARKIAVDPFAESPFMEHAIEEGLPSEGGKLDDISVVAALCKRNE